MERLTSDPEKVTTQEDPPEPQEVDRIFSAPEIIESAPAIALKTTMQCSLNDPAKMARGGPPGLQEEFISNDPERVVRVPVSHGNESYKAQVVTWSENDASTVESERLNSLDEKRNAKSPATRNCTSNHMVKRYVLSQRVNSNAANVLHVWGAIMKDPVIPVRRVADGNNQTSNKQTTDSSQVLSLTKSFLLL